MALHLRSAAVLRAGGATATTAATAVAASRRLVSGKGRDEGIGARAEEAAAGSAAARAIDSAARAAGFTVPPEGPESSDAPTPEAAESGGSPGPDLMGGVAEVMRGAVKGDATEAALGVSDAAGAADSGRAVPEAPSPHNMGSRTKGVPEVAEEKQGQGAATGRGDART